MCKKNIHDKNVTKFFAKNISIKQFINPVRDINKHYHSKSDTGLLMNIKYPNGAASTISLKQSPTTIN